MATLKAVVIPGNRSKDGTYPVKIRIYNNYQTRRLATNLVAEPKDLTKSLKIKKDTELYSKAGELIKRMRKIIADLSPCDLEEKPIDWVVAKVKEGLKGESFSLDFFTWADKYLQSKNESTRRAYDRALNAFSRFLGERILDINDISRSMLLDFMEFVDAEPKMYFSKATGKTIATDKQKVNKASSSLHLMKLQHIFNAAKYRYNDEDADVIRIPRSPFDNIKKIFPSGGKGQKALSRETMQMLIEAQTDNEQIRAAIDAFLLSFCLMGANLADMYSAIPFKGKTWIYQRIKTSERRSDGAELRVVIPHQAEVLIERLQNGKSGWWLPVLHQIGAKKHTCNEKINEALREWQREMGVEDFTFYAARHTFATLARSLGHDLALVNDCLCHKDGLDDGRRYAPSTWEQRNAVNQSVVDSFRW